MASGMLDIHIARTVAGRLEDWRVGSSDGVATLVPSEGQLGAALDFEQEAGNCPVTVFAVQGLHTAVLLWTAQDRLK